MCIRSVKRSHRVNLARAQRIGNTRGAGHCSARRPRPLHRPAIVQRGRWKIPREVLALRVHRQCTVVRAPCRRKSPSVPRQARCNGSRGIEDRHVQGRYTPRLHGDVATGRRNARAEESIGAPERLKRPRRRSPDRASQCPLVRRLRVVAQGLAVRRADLPTVCVTGAVSQST
jgi:hypothetical protein